MTAGQVGFAVGFVLGFFTCPLVGYLMVRVYHWNRS